MGFGSNPSAGRTSSGNVRDLAITLTLDKKTIQQLDKAMRLLPGKIYKKVVVQASRAAMTPMLSQAKRNVPVEHDVLKKSLGKITRTYAKNGVVFVVVGPRKGYKQTITREDGTTRNVDPRNYSHLVEFGTTSHDITPRRAPVMTWTQDGQSFQVPSVDHPGTRPTGFMRTAFDSKKGLVIAKYTKQVSKSLEKEVKKLGAGTRLRFAI